MVISATPLMVLHPATLRMKKLSVHHSGSLGSFETKMKWKNSRLRGFHRSAA